MLYAVPTVFPETNQFFSFLDGQVSSMSEMQKYDIVHRKLFELIKDSSKNFLLSEVVDFLLKANKNKVLSSNVSINSFEYWLNSQRETKKLSAEEDFLIREKIVGKKIPRSEYGRFFPLRKDKFFIGSHHVTAHSQPDIDTLVASFINWLDSFACRVSKNFNYWNVPQGEPNEFSSYFFFKFFGNDLFSRIARYKSRIFNVAIDFSDQGLLEYLSPEASTKEIPFSGDKHYILTDKRGYYVGAWHQEDAKAVQNILNLFNEVLTDFNDIFIEKLLFVLHSLENNKKTSFLEQDILSQKIFELKYKNSSDKRKNLKAFLEGVLELEQGVETTINHFFLAISKKDRTLEKSYKTFKDLFREYLVEAEVIYKNRESISYQLVSSLFQSYHKLYASFVEVRNALDSYLNRLDIAIKIKRRVLNLNHRYIFTKTPTKDILTKSRDNRFVTVIFKTDKGELVPVGAVDKKKLLSSVHGYVSLRDFSNTDEIELDSSIQIISILDHHRINIKTDECINVNIANVQSSSTLLAEMILAINEAYSSLGFSKDDLEKNLKLLEKRERTQEFFLLKNTLMAVEDNLLHQKDYWIDEKREFQEYILLIVAILDDTDFLTKSEIRDLKVLTKLLNRVLWIQSKKIDKLLFLGSLSLKEGISYLVNREPLKSLCKEIYSFREQILTKFLSSPEEYRLRLFEDCKIQKSNYSISQLKLLKGNETLFNSVRNNLINLWFSFIELKQNVFFHLHMLSTVKSLIVDEDTNLDGLDEIWIFSQLELVNEKVALREFLQKFIEAECLNLKHFSMSIEGNNCKQLDFLKDFSTYGKFDFVKNDQLKRDLIILRFDKGSINSRKGQITPYLLEF